MKNKISMYCLLVSVRGGGGGPPDFFVKFDLEIAIDQPTRACDRTFKGVSDSGCSLVPAGQSRPFLSKLCPIMPNHLNMLITKIFRCFTCSWWSLELVYEFSSRLDKK